MFILESKGGIAMPSHYAHFRFGTAALALLPGDSARSVQRFRRLYDVGLHGPDLFYHSFGRAGTSTLGIRYHELTGKAFFTRVCRAIRMERSEAAASYLYGALSHYVLDSVLHPYILELSRDTGVSHARLESEFDRYLLELDGKLPADGQKLTAHLKLTEGECDTVAKFYPPATAKSVKNALADTARFTKWSVLPEGMGRKLLEKGLDLFGEDTRSLLIGNQPDPRCVHLCPEILEHYNAALARFPEYLTQLQAHMTYNAGLGEEFEANFA